MRYITFGGWRLSKVGLGTSQFANPGWGYGAHHSPQDLVRHALDLGVTHFDTTDIYGAGGSERILGAALSGVEGVVVATSLFNVAPSSRLLVARARASVKRLRRPLDLCYVLWSNPLVNDRHLMAGMRQLREEGSVKEVGVSDYGVDRWRAAEAHLGSPVSVNQALYSLVRRYPEETVIPWAVVHGRLVVVAQPLSTGLLSGAYHRGKRVSGPWRSGNRLFSSENLESTKDLMETIGEVARAHDATAAQVALAYVLRHENVVAIPGARTVGQLAENVAAADLVLGEDEWRALADAAKKSEAAGIMRPRSSSQSGLQRARNGVRSARHWGRGVRLLAATAREDLRHRASPPRD